MKRLTLVLLPVLILALAGPFPALAQEKGTIELKSIAEVEVEDFNTEGQKVIKRVPATEVLLNNSVVADRIRDAEDDDLPAIMAGSAEEGMHLFNTSLALLIEHDWIDLKTAEQYSPNREALRSAVRGISVKADLLVSKSPK